MPCPIREPMGMRTPKERSGSDPLYKETQRVPSADGSQPDHTKGWGAAKGAWVNASPTQKQSEEYPQAFAEAIGNAVDEALADQDVRYGAREFEFD